MRLSITMQKNNDEIDGIITNVKKERRSWLQPIIILYRLVPCNVTFHSIKAGPHSTTPALACVAARCSRRDNRQCC